MQTARGCIIPHADTLVVGAGDWLPDNLNTFAWYTTTFQLICRAFTIRDGMTYTDGVPVTAANYAYAIKRACSPVVNGNYSNILFDIVGCEEWRSADVEAQRRGRCLATGGRL